MLLDPPRFHVRLAASRLQLAKCGDSVGKSCPLERMLLHDHNPRQRSTARSHFAPGHSWVSCQALSVELPPPPLFIVVSLAEIESFVLFACLLRGPKISGNLGASSARHLLFCAYVLCNVLFMFFRCFGWMH